MFDSKQPYEMICEEARLLIVPMWVNDPGVTDKESEAFQAHLLTCSACAEEYEETKEIVSLVREHWGPISEETWNLLGQAKRPNQLQNQRSLSRRHTMTVEEGWEDLKRRIPELAQLEKRQRRLQLFRRISAVAACLVIGVFIWMAFLIYSKPEIAQESVPEQVAFSPKASIKVELVSQNGNILIPASQEIITAEELKTLIINNKHRMVMNVGATVTVEPLIENSRLGCLVKLASGEIFAHVEHDGNPFVVNTAHGNAIITGTAFDVKATDTTTTLLVTEGTVQFGSKKCVVKVAAGQMSKIVGQSAPSSPILCNADELTSWATGYTSEPVFTIAEPNNDPWELLLLLMEEQIVLDETNYDLWVEQKRKWFKQNFPWIFQLKDALAKEGIEVGYPELLIKSGDVWQFVCLQKFLARFFVPNFDSLLKTAVSCGFDKEWLLKNVPIAKMSQNKSLLTQNLTGIAAFEQLLKYANGTEEPPYFLYLSDACKYLAETRSLIWFVVRDGKYDLTDEERTEVLDLLQKEITAARKCQNDVLYPWEKEKPSCDDMCQKPADSVIGYIETMKAVEERIAEYEISQ